MNQLTKWVSESPENLIGAACLAHGYDIAPVQPLRYLSRIGRSRSLVRIGNFWQTMYQESYRPEPTLAGNLEFMLKHERIHLEFLARLFAVTRRNEIAEWVEREPTGRYSRTAGFLFEYLTGQEKVSRLLSAR